MNFFHPSIRKAAPDKDVHCPCEQNLSYLAAETATHLSTPIHKHIKKQAVALWGDISNDFLESPVVVRQPNYDNYAIQFLLKLGFSIFDTVHST